MNTVRVWTCGHVHTRLRREPLSTLPNKIISPTKLQKFVPWVRARSQGSVDMSTRPHSNRIEMRNL